MCGLLGNAQSTLTSVVIWLPAQGTEQARQTTAVIQQRCGLVPMHSRGGKSQ